MSPISLTNTDANLLNKILANKINQWIKNIKYNKVKFIPNLSQRFKSGLTPKTPINIIKEVLYDHANRYRKKEINEIQYPFKI